MHMCLKVFLSLATGGNLLSGGKCILCLKSEHPTLKRLKKIFEVRPRYGAKSHASQLRDGGRQDFTWKNVGWEIEIPQQIGSNMPKVIIYMKNWAYSVRSSMNKS